MNDNGQYDPVGSVEELTFELSDPAYPFVDVSVAEGCRVELQTMLPREDGRCAELFTVVGAPPTRVVERVEAHDHADPTTLARREDGGVFEFVVSGTCPVYHLATLGTVPRTVRGAGGEGRIVVEVLPGYDVSEITAEFLDEHASAELVSKRETTRPVPLFTDRELEQALDERLTDRQREVLRTAYEGGYYERPRGKTGEELAADMGISSATFSQHIRAAERNLLAILHDDETI